MKSFGASDPQTIRAAYDKKAVTYDQTRLRNPFLVRLDESERRFIHRHLGNAQTVLEVGAGTGRLTNELLSSASRVVAVDLSAEMLRVLENTYAHEPRVEPVRLDVFDLEDLPQYGHFDALVSFRVLPHIADLERVLQLFRNAVKPGGRLLLDFWNPYSYTYFKKRSSSVYNHYVTYRQAHKLLSAANLSLVEMTGAGFEAPFATNLEFLGRTPLRRLAYSLLAACESRTPSD